MSDQVARGFIPVSTELLRDWGPMPGDMEEYWRFAKPYRNGILDRSRLRRVSRERLIRDAEAMRAALHRATEELNDVKQWAATRFTVAR